MESEKEISIKEKRIRELVFLYYSREDVKKAIFNFSKNSSLVSSDKQKFLQIMYFSEFVGLLVTGL